jgi:DNA-binding CsgD family transcriptional regulator/GAF domain-containing protein
MPTLSRAQQAARQRIEEVAAGGHAPEELGRRLLEAIAIAVPSDGQRLWTVDPSSLLLNRLVAATPGDGPFRLRWLRGIYLSPDIRVPYFAPHELMRCGATAVAYQDRQEDSIGLPPSLRDLVAPDLHYRQYHAGQTPAGGSTRLCLRSGGRWIGLLDVVSRDPRHPLAPTDFAFLRLVGPAIARALDASIARESALAAATVPTTSLPPEASGVLVITPEHRVGFASPAAERWLQRLGDARRDEHAPLPTAVWTALAGLRNGHDPPRAVSTVVAPSVSGPIRVEASPAGEDGTVAIVLAAARPSGPPAIPASWPLTARERQIVELLLGGSSNRRLAAVLHVSENTVETHLAHIYEKLDSHGRTELIGRLFRDAYLPALASEDDTLSP